MWPISFEDERSLWKTIIRIWIIKILISLPAAHLFPMLVGHKEVQRYFATCKIVYYIAPTLTREQSTSSG